MIRVACCMCREERDVYPSGVRQVQLCHRPRCRSEALKARILTPGVRPRKPLREVNGELRRNCTRCRRWKPLEREFFPKAYNPDGSVRWYQSWCKPCHREAENDRSMDLKALAMMRAERMR